jgi:hypothetical protein
MTLAETFEDYRKRVLSYLGDRAPLRVLAATPARLDRIVSDLPPFLLSRRPAPGKWSIREILAHLADAELAMAWRIRNMIATPGVRLAWWDEHLWSDRLGYARVPVSRSLRVFAALRDSNMALLKSVGPVARRQRYGVHDTRGRQTVEAFVRMEAAHDLNHMRQIAAIAARTR